MSINGGVCVANGSSMEDAGDENRNHETRTMCSKALRAKLKSTDPALEGRSNNVEQLVRPPQPGRKAHRKTSTEDNRGRWREGTQGRDEERQKTEHLGGKERERQRQRKMERAETHERAQDKQERGSTDSLSSSNSDVQLSSILEGGERSNSSQRGHAYLKPQGTGFTRATTTNLNFQSPRPAIQSRSTPLSPQRLPSRPAAGNTHSYSFNARDTDPFWVEVITGAASEQLSPNHQNQTYIPHATISEPEEDEDEGNADDDEEEGSGVVEVMSQPMTSGVVLPSVPFGDMRMSKREKNRIKSLRKRQRRREKWRQSQQQDNRQSSTGNPTTTTSSSSSSEDDEAMSMRDKEGFICAVCLDVYFSPYMCHPCNHIFCEPCLRTLAKNSPTNTPCPLCRTIITHVFFQKELNQTARTFFPKEYLSRKQNFQKASCAKWPLPSCRKLFRIFGAGFQRQPSPVTRRQFPHGGGYRLETMDFEDDSRGWRFDMDMVIIYIYSVNWIIGFFIFCFLCYLFFPSF